VRLCKKGLNFIIAVPLSLLFSGCGVVWVTLSNQGGGANGPTVTAIYRSVGPTNTAALASGAGNNMTVAGNIATFVIALPNNIGVGDAIQYQVTGVWNIAFISSRMSNTVYAVQNVAGFSPSATTANTSWSIFRAYTGFANALVGTENTGINAAVRNFETWTNGQNMVANNEQWNFAFYADAVDGYTNFLTISASWISDSTHFLKLYTPFLTSEVGISQRHNGSWLATGYELSFALTFSTAGLYLGNPLNLWIDGFQIAYTNTVISPSSMQPVQSFTVASTGINTSISNSIIMSQVTASAPNIGGIAVQLPSGNVFYFWNNIIFNSGVTASSVGFFTDTGSTVYFYNNTIYGFSQGLEQNNTVTLIAKNNIVQGATVDGYLGIFTTSDYNLSNDVTTTGGAHDLTSKVVTFVNSGDNDFLLSVADISAKGAGESLVNDPYFFFSTDITNISRTIPWDIGSSTPH
jgi:hypothetical protein